MVRLYVFVLAKFYENTSDIYHTSVAFKLEKIIYSYMYCLLHFFLFAFNYYQRCAYLPTYTFVSHKCFHPYFLLSILTEMLPNLIVLYSTYLKAIVIS